MRLNMVGFSYKHGEKISFDGVYGLVELRYVGEADPFIESLGMEPFQSHFVACVCVDGIKYFAEGIVPESAVHNLYKDIARHRAMEDLGQIDA